MSSGAGFEDSFSLLEEAARRLAEQPAVLRIDTRRLLVVGDTHGYPEVSEWALQVAREEGVDAVVFLGDYVDRGPRGVENLELVLRAFLENGNVYLLRGNHEDPGMNLSYGFAEEAYEKRGENYFGAASIVYIAMPVAAIAGPVLLVHAGIPCKKCSMNPEPPVLLEEIAERAEKMRSSDEAFYPLEADPVIGQLLWNDPRGTIDWFLPGPRGPGTYLYGKAAWREFLHENGLSLIIRGHEVVDGTHAWLGDGGQRVLEDELGLGELEGGVVTVFSSLYHGKRAAVLLLDLGEEKLKPIYYPGDTHGSEEKSPAGGEEDGSEAEGSPGNT